MVANVSLGWGGGRWVVCGDMEEMATERKLWNSRVDCEWRDVCTWGFCVSEGFVSQRHMISSCSGFKGLVRCAKFDCCDVCLCRIAGKWIRRACAD